MDTDQDSLISSMEFSSGLAQLNQEMKQGMGGMEGVSGIAPSEATGWISMRCSTSKSMRMAMGQSPAPKTRPFGHR